MERRDVEIFLVVAEELHFGRSGERLHVSTARVSQTIRKLERQIGAPLFERTSRRVALTPIGERLRDDIKPAYQQILAGIQRATAAGRGVEGVLRVGFFGGSAGQFVLKVADVYRSRNPGSEVRIKEIQYDEVLAPLRDGEVDMLFINFPVEEPDLTNGPVLVREARMLAVSARHPFARRDSVTFDDLARDKVLRSPGAIPDYYERYLVPQETSDGRPIERGQVFQTYQEMLALVGAGKGIFPVPAGTAEYFARPDVAYIPIRDAPPYERGFVWRASAETNRIRVFNETAHELSQL